MQRLQPEEIESQVFPLVRRGYEREKVDAFLQVVAAYYREALRAADEEGQMPPPQPRAFDAIGGQIATILGTASAAAEDLKAEAEREAQMMRRMAAEEAAQTTQAATDHLIMARQFKADAQQEAEILRSEASEEVATLRQEARDRIAHFEADARARIAKLEETAKSNVEAFLDEARRRYQELRVAERQSAAHLGSVQTTIRKAREALSADYATMQIGDLLGHATEFDRDDGLGGTSQALERTGDPPVTPVGLARLHWPENGGPNGPNGSVRRPKRTVYTTSGRDSSRPPESFSPGTNEPEVNGPPPGR